jgi:tRNA nucleotidyltransferase (CCA-adding enzyme)
VHFPELAVLRQIPAGPVEHHPEGDTLTHTLMVLDQAVLLGGLEMLRVAALLHDLGKGTTPSELLPRHHGHEGRGVPLVAALGSRIRLPADHVVAAQLVSELHLKVHRLREMRPLKVVDLIARLQRGPLKPEGLALVTEADSRGRGVANPRVEGPQLLREISRAVSKVSAKDVLSENPHLKGPQLGEAIRQARADAAEKIRKEILNNSH